FYPRQLVMDMGFALLIIIFLGFLAWRIPAMLGPKADPAETVFLPRPEWYYIPIFQYLKYWKASTSVIGILVIPGILGFLLIGLPFFDRSLERRPWKRPLSVSAFTAVFVALGFFGIQSHREDMQSPGAAAQLQKQRQHEEEFMKEPFQPEVVGASAGGAATNPLAGKGQSLFTAQGCDACHGENGTGTAAAPKLTRIGTKYDSAKLESLLKSPTSGMQLGGMQPVDLKQEDLDALVAYLQTLN
ncbi:MAG TPA: c-type cytochrome, partial [Terriglobales bacterium]|nr:c-type cytochrome [Terriglobales bacterium]